MCGRDVVLRTADDGYETSRNRAAMVEFDRTALGIVGGLATGDGGSVEIVQQSGIPVVSLPTSQGFEALPTVFDTNPPYADIHQPTAKTRFLYDQGVRTAAYVYADIAQAHYQIAEQRAQLEAAGIKVVLDLAMPLTTLSYASAARAVANSKADYLFFLHDAGADAAMAREVDNAGYKLKFEEYLTSYGSNFIERGGQAVEGTTSWIRTLPSEDGGQVPEQARFLEWMGRTAPGEVTDTWASDSWVGTKAFFDNLQALARTDHQGGAGRPAAERRHVRRRRVPRADPVRPQAKQRLPRRHDRQGRHMGAPDARFRLPLLSSASADQASLAACAWGSPITSAGPWP